MLTCKDCGGSTIAGEDDVAGIIVNRTDLGRAIDQTTRGTGDESRRLPDVLHYLLRAIPDLYPLAALLERETGRKLTP